MGQMDISDHQGCILFLNASFRAKPGLKMDLQSWSEAIIEQQYGKFQVGTRGGLTGAGADRPSRAFIAAGV